MTDPTVTRLGNLRFAGIPVTGWPADPLALAEVVRGVVAANPGEPAPAIIGPACLWCSHGPEDTPPARWDGLAGWAITGMVRPGAAAPDGRRLLVEDYRNLVAWTLPHRDAAADLGRTWRRLADAAGAAGRRLRPYWRVCLRARTLADGNLLPVTEVQVFVEP